MSVDAVLDRLPQLHPKRIDLSLGRVERLLAELGHPERELAPVVHVAGTNGKGSLIALLSGMLRAAGYRVQAYTSPHLVRFGERIRLVDRDIEDDHLLALLEECERVNAGQPITFFEITTAAAFLAFAREPADILLLEVGLGGRLDATNVVAKPLLSAITPVAIDHTGFLGDKLDGIAFEKAGILKSGVTAVTGRQPSAAMRAIHGQAEVIATPLVRFAPNPAEAGSGVWSVQPEREGFSVFVDGSALSFPPLPLAGPHQLENAGQAIACLHHLTGFEVDQAAMARGLQDAVWPARMQNLSGGPLAAGLPAGSELWLDGGHNPAAAEALAETLKAFRATDPAPRPTFLITGMLNSKDVEGFLTPLAAHADQLYGVSIPGEAASLGGLAIATRSRAAGLRARASAGVSQALNAISQRQGGGPPPRILICGSLYLAGHVLALDGTGGASAKQQPAPR